VKGRPHNGLYSVQCYNTPTSTKRLSHSFHNANEIIRLRLPNDIFQRNPETRIRPYLAFLNLQPYGSDRQSVANLLNRRVVVFARRHKPYGNTSGYITICGDILFLCTGTMCACWGKR